MNTHRGIQRGWNGMRDIVLISIDVCPDRRALDLFCGVRMTSVSPTLEPCFVVFGGGGEDV